MRRELSIGLVLALVAGVSLQVGCSSKTTSGPGNNNNPDGGGLTDAAGLDGSNVLTDGSTTGHDGSTTGNDGSTTGNDGSTTGTDSGPGTDSGGGGTDSGGGGTDSGGGGTDSGSADAGPCTTAGIAAYCSAFQTSCAPSFVSKYGTIAYCENVMAYSCAVAVTGKPTYTNGVVNPAACAATSSACGGTPPVITSSATSPCLSLPGSLPTTQNCSSDQQCTAGQYCTFQSASGNMCAGYCMDYLTTGDSCGLGQPDDAGGTLWSSSVDDNNCGLTQTGNYCLNTAIANANDAGIWGFDPSQDAICQPITFGGSGAHCVGSTIGGVPAWGASATNLQCQAGFYCLQESCVPVLALGASCASSLVPCATGLNCAFPTGTDAGALTCQNTNPLVATAVGQGCGTGAANAVCAGNMYCAGTAPTQTCQAKLDAGAPCSTAIDSECGGGSSICVTATEICGLPDSGC